MIYSLKRENDVIWLNIWIKGEGFKRTLPHGKLKLNFVYTGSNADAVLTYWEQIWPKIEHFQNMVATVKTSIRLIFSSEVGLREKQTKLCLAEYRFIFEKIDINWIPLKCRFWSSKFQANLGTSHHKMKKLGPMNSTKSWKTISKRVLTTIWAILDHLFTQSNWIYLTYFWLI